MCGRRGREGLGISWEKEKGAHQEKEMGDHGCEAEVNGSGWGRGLREGGGYVGGWGREGLGGIVGRGRRGITGRGGGVMGSG